VSYRQVGSPSSRQHPKRRGISPRCSTSTAPACCTTTAVHHRSGKDSQGRQGPLREAVLRPGANKAPTVAGRHAHGAAVRLMGYGVSSRREGHSRRARSQPGAGAGGTGTRQAVWTGLNVLLPALREMRACETTQSSPPLGWRVFLYGGRPTRVATLRQRRARRHRA
jgi:hypothetical protein